LTSTALPYSLPMLSFIETKLFARLADEYLGVEGLLALQVHLLANAAANISAATLKKLKAEING
jgi:hypothetical protein